jgi:hypothetical protein
VAESCIALLGVNPCVMRLVSPLDDRFDPMRRALEIARAMKQEGLPFSIRGKKSELADPHAGCTAQRSCTLCE